MDKHILQQFLHWWETATKDSPLNQKSAVCVSSVDENGFPQGRFVDLKTVDESGFVFCTSYLSQKGKHLLSNPKVSITAWWDHVGYQVRIVGFAKKISDQQADNYWQTRSVSAQRTTTLFAQSEPWDCAQNPQTFYSQHSQPAEVSIPRPDSWGGFLVVPEQIEFLTFREDRVHVRQHFHKQGEKWIGQILQP